MAGRPVADVQPRPPGSATRMRRSITRLAIVLAAACAGMHAQGDPSGWTPVPGRLATRWAADVSPDRVHPEYPRPQLVRKDWHSAPIPKYAHVFRAGHPASRRCSFLAYSRYARSSRLAIRAPRSGLLLPYFGIGALSLNG